MLYSLLNVFSISRLRYTSPLCLPVFPYDFPYNTVEKEKNDHGSIFKMLTRKSNTKFANSFITVSRGLRLGLGMRFLQNPLQRCASWGMLVLLYTAKIAEMNELYR